MTVPAIVDDGRFQPRSLSDYEPSGGARARSPRSGRRGHLRLVRSEVPPPWRPTEPPPALVLVLRQVLEILDGRRPVGQLPALVPDDEVADLRQRVGDGRHALRRVHTCCPVPGAVELAATVEHRSATGQRRVLAAAARFERVRDRWSCRAFRLL